MAPRPRRPPAPLGGGGGSQGSHCLFNSCCCSTSASLPARETRVARPSRTEEEQPDTKGEVGGRGTPRRPPRRPRGQGRGAGPAAARRWGGRQRSRRGRGGGGGVDRARGCQVPLSPRPLAARPCGPAAGGAPPGPPPVPGSRPAEGRQRGGGGGRPGWGRGAPRGPLALGGRRPWAGPPGRCCPAAALPGPAAAPLASTRTLPGCPARIPPPSPHPSRRLLAPLGCGPALGSPPCSPSSPLPPRCPRETGLPPPPRHPAAPLPALGLPGPSGLTPCRPWPFFSYRPPRVPFHLCWHAPQCSGPQWVPSMHPTPCLAFPPCPPCSQDPIQQAGGYPAGRAFPTAGHRSSFGVSPLLPVMPHFHFSAGDCQPPSPIPSRLPHVPPGNPRDRSCSIFISCTPRLDSGGW